MEKIELNNQGKVIIIGASISGLTAAKRLRRLNDKIEILLIDSKDYIGYPITGIPYFTAGILKNHETFTVSYEEQLISVYNLKLLKSSWVYKIDFSKNIVYIKNLKTEVLYEENYTYLIIASGIKANISEKSSSMNLKNVFYINSIEKAIEARKYLEKTGINKITIVGDNIISLSFINTFLTTGYELNILTKENRLFTQFDPDFSFLIEEELIKRDVKIYKNFNIIKFKKTNNIVKSIVSDFTYLDVQVVFYFDEIVPNTGFIDKTIMLSGINNNAIINENFKTYFNNVYTTGSVAEVKDKITEKNIYTISARESSIRGRIVANIVHNEILKENNIEKNKNEKNINLYKGYIRNEIGFIKNFIFGITGINEEEAKKNGFDTITISIFSGDKERFVSFKNKMYIKLIIDKINRKILGAQICSKNSNIDKRLDVLYTAIYSDLTIDNLINLNLSYSPEISLIKDPINIIGMIGANILDCYTNYITNFDFNINENVFILDVRSKKEREKSFLLKSYWIPLTQLRTRLNEIPKDKKIYIYGNNGIRGYIAERILKQNNFNFVYNIGGGINLIKIKENIF